MEQERAAYNRHEATELGGNLRGGPKGIGEGELRKWPGYQNKKVFRHSWTGKKQSIRLSAHLYGPLLLPKHDHAGRNGERGEHDVVDGRNNGGVEQVQSLVQIVHLGQYRNGNHLQSGWGRVWGQEEGYRLQASSQHPPSRLTAPNAYVCGCTSWLFPSSVSLMAMPSPLQLITLREPTVLQMPMYTSRLLACTSTLTQKMR
jgi:hypothetical protein